MTSALHGLRPRGDLPVVPFRSPAEWWRERKGNERGTAPLEGPASDTDLVYQPVDDGWPEYEEPTYKYH